MLIYAVYCIRMFVLVDGKLDELNSRLSAEVMVPLTSRAFMVGTLVHTNEILVLLGENYFIGKGRGGWAWTFYAHRERYQANVF